MKRNVPSTRLFLLACSIVLVGAVGWRLLAPKTAQGPAPVSAQVGGGPPQTPTSRNIIVFETDDQRWDSLERQITTPSGFEYVMQNVWDIFVENGVRFTNAFVTNPTCCPSRAAQLAGGFYSHHTGVLTNTWPNGGALRFKDDEALAVRMKKTDYIPEAYYTVLIGKYMNGYDDITVEADEECEKVKKARYIPPGWDIFIVRGEDRDWDRGYQITVGGSVSVDCPNGVILPDDVCGERDQFDMCIENRWHRDEPETPSPLEQDLLDMGIPQDVIDELQANFEFVEDEDERVYTYLPELEHVLAISVLENLPNPEDPLFMMLAVAPPHGPTQLDSGFIDCDGTGEPTGSFTYDERAFGEEDVSDKPSWMRDNYDKFQDYEACESCLLECYRGSGCDSKKCPGGTSCAQGNSECRDLQQVFRDELGSLNILDDFIGDIFDTAPGNTVFFFTSDHGTMYGEHGEFQKGVPYEESIRVPFAVAGKGTAAKIREGVEIDDMIAFDLDMPATILEIAGYTRDEISNPDPDDGVIHSDGCSLLGILETSLTGPPSWGACYTSAPAGLLPREEILIQSMRNLAPNATPTFAGLRFEDSKFVLTDTLEEEFYDLGDDEFEEDNSMHSDPQPDVSSLRNQIKGDMGIAIVPNPRTADWNLPIAKPGVPYPCTITFSAIGGSGNYEWCLWNFVDVLDDEIDGCDACPDPDNPDPNDLGCLLDPDQA